MHPTKNLRKGAKTMTIEMKKLHNITDGANALYLAFAELVNRYKESESALKQNNDFEAGRAEAYFEALEILNNRISVMNAPYEEDFYNAEFAKRRNL